MRNSELLRVAGGLRRRRGAARRSVVKRQHYFRNNTSSGRLSSKAVVLGWLLSRHWSREQAEVALTDAVAAAVAAATPQPQAEKLTTSFSENKTLYEQSSGETNQRGAYEIVAGEAKYDMGRTGGGGTHHHASRWEGLKLLARTLALTYARQPKYEERKLVIMPSSFSRVRCSPRAALCKTRRLGTVVVKRLVDSATTSR